MCYVKSLFVLFIISFSVWAHSCANAKKVLDPYVKEDVETFAFPARANSTFTLRTNYDLKGKTYVMPEGVTIKVKKGLIKNGTLIGRDTRIEGEQPVFDKVTLKGDWVVPEISTELFEDLNYDNSLRDVMALTNPNVNNTVFVGSGTYYIDIEKNKGFGIVIGDSTKFILKGTIVLRPNNFTNYDIVLVKGNNISIEGSGTIIGDRINHKGETGEWGMGIDVSHSENVFIKDITVNSCWGDCIYVGDNSKSVSINNCNLSLSRRQGISVTSGEHISITDCSIRDISGTDPQYAVDIEPNAGEKVVDVTIKNMVSDNCVGGINVWGNAELSLVKDVTIKNCIINGSTSRYPMRIYKAEGVVVDNCDVESEGKYAVLTQYITRLSVTNNTLRASGRKPLNVLQCKSTNIEKNIQLQKR